jgi:hypothetical protein
MSGASRQLRIMSCQVVGKDNLLGLVDVEFSGLRLKRLAVIRGRKGPLVVLPSAAIIYRDGQQRRDGAGKPELLRWSNGRAAKSQIGFRLPC